MRLSDGAKEGCINLLLALGFSVSLGVLIESPATGCMCFFMTLLIVRA